MKKLMLIFVIIGIVFIAGCIGGEKATDTKTPTDSQTNQKTVAEATDLIIKNSDLPAGFVLDEQYTDKRMLKKDLAFTMKNNRNSYEASRIRDNKIPNDWRYIGENIKYTAPSGKEITISITVFDSNEGLKEVFEQFDLKLNPNGKVNENIEKSGHANIGDYSYWEEDKDSDPYLKYSKLIFSIKNNYITMLVRDDKENGHDLALKVAKLIAGRLG